MRGSTAAMELGDALLASQQRAVDSVAQSMPEIRSAAECVSRRWDAGGRLIYVGAGASALIAMQDGAELPGTFGLDPARIVYVVAGGAANAFQIDGSAEDDVAAAERDVAALGPLDADVAIAVSASGSTPYTVVAAKQLRDRGAAVVGLANRPGSPLLALADVAVLLDSGAEALQGSTRLAAGTAQKCALGLISTLANAELGHVFRGLMVNVRPSNAKLKRRALDIIGSIAGVDDRAAAASLERAGDDVKSAVLIASGARDKSAADALLKTAGGRIGAALNRLEDAKDTEFPGRGPIAGSGK